MNPGKVSEVTYKRAILKNLNSKNEGVKPGVNAANIQLEDITAVVSSNCIHPVDFRNLFRFRTLRA